MPIDREKLFRLIITYGTLCVDFGHWTDVQPEQSEIGVKAELVLSEIASLLDLALED